LIKFDQNPANHDEEIAELVSAWQEDQNNKKCKINWQFATKYARIKLIKLYPSIYA